MSEQKLEEMSSFWGTSVFEEGIKRYAIHSKLDYIGKIAVRDIDGKSDFECEEAVSLAEGFAHKICEDIKK